MAKDKKGKGSGTKDACYHKVKSRYSVWPSAYASGALVKCRKVGAKNWGNKSESFEIQDGVFEGAIPEPINPEKHRAKQKNEKIRNMMKSPNKNEAEVAKKKVKGPELPMEQYTAAVDFFMNEGINEDGLEMIIEETGLEKFAEFVEYLTDQQVLTEARAAKKARKGAKSYAQVKAEIDAKEKAKLAKREISVDKTKKATATAKKAQPVEKKPVRDAIARGVFRAVDAYKKGMERHRAAMDTAKKAGKVVGAIAKEVPTGVKMAGKATKAAYKVATKEEVELDEAPYQVYGSRDGKKEKKINKPVKSKKYADAKAAELVDTHKKTGGKYGMETTRVQYTETLDPVGKEEVEVEEGYKPIDKKKENEMYRRAGNLARTSLSSKGKKKLETAKKSAKIVSAISSQKEDERFAKMADEKARSNYSESRDPLVQKILDEAGKKCWKGYKKAGTQTLFGKTYNRCVKANEEVENVEEGLRDKVGEKVKKHINKYAYKQEIHDNPGWLRKPEKRAALNKAVRDDIKKNPKAAVKYAAGEVNRKVRQKLRAAVGKGLKDRIRIPNED